jgi:TetR/AcrR family transcriptional regulator, transcriptional repressor for nem operon
MRTPQVTKQTIIEKAGILFNTMGYKNTSISDITNATGLTKGALYTHFTDKAALEVQAFEHLMFTVMGLMRNVIKAEATAPLKLKAVINFFTNYVTNPPIKGGCPLLNLSVEADDANNVLKSKALKQLKTLEISIISIIEKGIKYQQIYKHVNAPAIATLLIASLEGGIMMSKLQNNNTAVNTVAKYLQQVINEISI